MSTNLSTSIMSGMTKLASSIPDDTYDEYHVEIEAALDFTEALLNGLCNWFNPKA